MLCKKKIAIYVRKFQRNPLSSFQEHTKMYV